MWWCGNVFVVVFVVWWCVFVVVLWFISAVSLPNIYPQQLQIAWEQHRPQIHLRSLAPHRGTPKWDGFIMENPIKMDDLGEKNLFLETPLLM